VKEKFFHKVTNKKLQIHKIALYLQSLVHFLIYGKMGEAIKREHNHKLIQNHLKKPQNEKA
jgi:hypothetical protein